MKRTDKKTALIRAAVISVAVACLILCAFVYFYDPVSNDLYGWLVHPQDKFRCPACGLTRAVYYILHLDFSSAFYYHAYLTVFFPVFAYIAVCLSVNLFAGKKIIPYPKNYAVYLYSLLAILLVFTIIRNFTSVIY